MKPKAGRPSEFEGASGRLVGKLTKWAQAVKVDMDAPRVIIIACSMDPEEPLGVGSVIQADFEVVTILERALEAARACVRTGKPS